MSSTLENFIFGDNTKDTVDFFGPVFKEIFSGNIQSPETIFILILVGVWSLIFFVFLPVVFYVKSAKPPQPKPAWQSDPFVPWDVFRLLYSFIKGVEIRAPRSGVTGRLGLGIPRPIKGGFWPLIIFRLFFSLFDFGEIFFHATPTMEAARDIYYNRRIKAGHHCPRAFFLSPSFEYVKNYARNSGAIIKFKVAKGFHLTHFSSKEYVVESYQVSPGDYFTVPELKPVAMYNPNGLRIA